MKKLSLLLALAAIVTAILPSCAGGKEAAATTTAETAAESETSEIDARMAISDELPERDFGGREFRI
jgi:hypothetical protein